MGRTSDSMTVRLKDLSIDPMVWGLMLWLLSGQPGFTNVPVGFLLLRYSVVFTVESLSLLYPLLYIDLYVLGDDALIS